MEWPQATYKQRIDAKLKVVLFSGQNISFLIQKTKRQQDHNLPEVTYAKNQINFKSVLFSKVVVMATVPSDFIFCQKCGRKFQSPIVYKFHMENSHPTIFVLKNEKSQSLISPTMKTISNKEEIHTEKNLNQAICNKFIAIEKKQQATSYFENQQDMTNFAQDSIIDIKNVQKMATENLSKVTTNLHSQISHQNVKRFQCKICSKCFDHQKYLKLHMSRIHREKLECQLCKKCFGCKVYLQQHIDGVHANEKKFECSVCKKCFSLNVHLRSHIRFVHENVRSYKCSLCELSFHLKDGLKVHIRGVHERPFKCEMCGGFWGSAHILKRHIFNRHNQSKPLECQTCKYRYSQQLGLRKHMKKRHNIGLEAQKKAMVKIGTALTIKCEYCEKMYTSIRGAHIHQAREHRSMVNINSV